MIRRPPRSTQGVSSAASDVYKRQEYMGLKLKCNFTHHAEQVMIFDIPNVAIKLSPQITAGGDKAINFDLVDSVFSQFEVKYPPINFNTNQRLQKYFANLAKFWNHIPVLNFEYLSESVKWTYEDIKYNNDGDATIYYNQITDPVFNIENDLVK
eukprot:TRINITY_DN11806_c0_g2_i2.p1 TRINITY_DN11806_c0_g2~~TRINITY_DN11806_c0_g2_i2.p1  ORF type:complete len:154 (+),score=29.68 TRINITY_DN11806_c0_g2_i2:106-567(+)